MVPELVRMIIVPTDYSQLSLAALDVAVRLSIQCHAEVRLLHVVDVQHWEVPGADFAPRPDDVDHAVAHYKAELEKLALQSLRQIVADRHLAELQTIVTFGHAAPGIIEYARQVSADLICMGTHGRRPLAHLVAGSTTEGVMRHSPIPVLVVSENLLARLS